MTKTNKAAPHKFPKPKLSGAVRSSDQFKAAVMALDANPYMHLITVEPIPGITNAPAAVLAALKRRYSSTYQLYAIGDIVYAVRLGASDNVNANVSVGHKKAAP